MTTNVYEMGSEFDTDTGTVNGETVWRLEEDTFYDRDIGGLDGADCTSCELVSLTLGGLTLDRAQVAQMIGATRLERMENAMLDRHREAIAGEWRVAV